MKKRVLIVAIVVLVILFVTGFFWFIVGNNSEEEVSCIKIQTSCCPCNMGGQEKCVSETEVDKYKINLSDCPEHQSCIAMFNCQIESCEYIDGECVAI